ncbi:hypothetical protein HPB52_013857 [Rhipicephalus sanguineus]|uniref:Uncharacterized protein n=1 Tax=Rhipicephalus sanguineus TaxID=34632 RepID=A0A9D4PLX1_RHISA|nr:hypothetical protein HPB52_013857 [Rhipicephalus sanguineus]
MKRWVSENTTRQGGVFHSTTSGTAYTPEDNPSAGVAPAAVKDVPAPRVSLAQLTYSVESGTTTSGQASSYETSDGRHSGTKRRAWKSEGQLRAARPRVAPAGETADPASLPESEQRRLPRARRAGTSPQQVPGLTKVGRSVSNDIETTYSPSRLPRVVRTTSKVIAASKPCAAECTRRDVGTATDAVPRGRERNWGDWMGAGRLPVMVGAALLSALLVASAVATTVAIMNRHSTMATGAADQRHLPDDIAGLVPTKPLMPGMPISESPLRGGLGEPADKAGAEDAWQRSEPADGDSAAEQPAMTYNNASGGFVTSENPALRRSTRPECGVVFYAYCQQPRQEFVYRASINACLATSDDHPAQLCNRGPNRFASWRECETNCVLTQPPREACLGETLLLGCRSKDVRTSWWWFDGRACRAWKFPWGGCPANGSAVFPTARQCTAHCTNPRYPACAAPRSAACGSAQLKFPFFAAVAPSSAVQGGTRCYRLTRRVLESHRCLTGANRFLTKTACELTCKKPYARPQ